jgi:hypothetical protein
MVKRETQNTDYETLRSRIRRETAHSVGLLELFGWRLMSGRNNQISVKMSEVTEPMLSDLALRPASMQSGEPRGAKADRATRYAV